MIAPFFRRFLWGFALILLGGMPCILPAQSSSFLGGCHTPKGRLHLLVLFIRFEDKDLIPGSVLWPDKEDTLPVMARGEINELFDAHPQTIGQDNHIMNLSQYYYMNSAGKFLITADIFPLQIPVKWIPNNGGNFFDRQFQMNMAAIQWIATNYPDFDWKRYDTRTNNPSYQYDNSTSKPDSVIDYVLTIYRDPGGSTGMGSFGNIPIKNTPYRISNGHTSIQSFSDKEHNWEYFKHEFGHNLYSAPHYNGANGTVGDKFYTQRGYGMMATTSNPFLVANAWERWWLGWLEPQEIHRSGTYILKDFATKNDALRLQIPGTQQYLWIENHQKISSWDDKLFFKEAGKHPQSAKGIYAFVSSDAGFNRSKPLNTFAVADCNLLKFYNGEGNFDYTCTGDTIMGEYFKCPVWKKVRKNPIAGQNDLQCIRYDGNHDNKVAYSPNHGNMDPRAGEQYEIWAEEVEGQPRYTCACTGDAHDAFDVGDEIGISGIVPVVHFPSYDAKQEKLSPYILNGITIQIASIDPQGNYTLKVNLDDYHIRKSTRWCGNLLIPAATIQDKKIWTVEKSATLTLDLSGTPDRSTFHPLTQTYTNPTELTIDANNVLVLKSKSKLIVDKYSRINLLGNAQIIVEKGASLIIRDGGELEISPTNTITIQDGGTMKVEAGGRFRQPEGSFLIYTKRAKVSL